MGFGVAGLGQAQALGDGERVALQLHGQRLQNASCPVEFSHRFAQPPVGVETTTTAVHDARRRQDEGSQLRQRLRGMVVQVNEQRGQREDVVLATPLPASQSLPPQSHCEVRAPSKLIRGV